MDAPPEEVHLKKLKALSDLWGGRATKPEVDAWLANFSDSPTDTTERNLNLLFLLSNFLYFDSDLIRELLRALYRDKFKYPLIEAIRKRLGNTTDATLLENEYAEDLKKSRFLGVGNPSESGCHLLYYFRQENQLRKDLFIHTHEAFSRNNPERKLILRSPEIERYVFIDDFSGTGEQGKAYSDEVVTDLKVAGKSTQYLVLFATKLAMTELRKTKFDHVDCIFELDDTYKVFGEHSRYFLKPPAGISKEFLLSLCSEYGRRLHPSHPLGHKDSQLLIGFDHNTPDNTLPIIWADGGSPPWAPIFRRYHKIYGED